MNGRGGGGGGSDPAMIQVVSEIEELGNEEEVEEGKQVHGRERRSLAAAVKEEPDSRASAEAEEEEDTVYYVVISDESNSNSSMDALLWTLNNAAAAAKAATAAIPNSSSSKSNTLVFLVHVFPEIRFIPTPLGKLPISQANPEQKEILMEQERTKRRQYLLKYLHLCSSSKVKVDTILIESNMEAKAILDLIHILNIKNLVFGSSSNNSSLKKLMKLRKDSGVADKVFHNAPHFCQVKIICQGKEISKPPPLPAAAISSSN